MAGLGRRTHYRKHLTDSVLNDFPEPQDDERIAKVVASRGGNQFDVVVAATTTNSSSTSSNNTPQLALLPTKFRKLVWVKRGDFVIVQMAAAAENEAEDSAGGIRFRINHILYKEQIKHLKAEELWPIDDPQFSDISGVAEEAELVNNDDDDDNDGDDDSGDDDGIVYDTAYGEDDDDLFVNTNRVANLRVQDSSSSESENDG